jgi:hypothetical protein
MHASNSIDDIKGELEDLVISAEFALKQIQTLHDDVTGNLRLQKESQTKIDDFKIPALLDTLVPVPVSLSVDEVPVPKVSSINLTNSTRRINTSDYLERTAVEI